MSAAVDLLIADESPRRSLAGRKGRRRPARSPDAACPWEKSLNRRCAVSSSHPGKARIGAVVRDPSLRTTQIIHEINPTSIPLGAECDLRSVRRKLRQPVAGVLVRQPERAPPVDLPSIKAQWAIAIGEWTASLPSGEMAPLMTKPGS